MQNFTKTIKLRLYVNKEQGNKLREVTEKYRLACNYVSQYIFDNDFEMNTIKINKALYYESRNLFKLKAQHTQSVFRTVTARYKSVRTQLKQRPYRYKDEHGKWQTIHKDLDWLWKPIKFKRPQADYVRNGDYRFIDKGTILSLATLGSRVLVSFAGDNFSEYLDGSWRLGTSKLVEVNNIWYLHIPVTKEIEEFSKEDVQHVVGIDRGIRFITTTYDERGKTEFISGKQVTRKRNSYNKVREQLRKKNTWSSKRALKRLSGRENRWMTDLNHQISKTLIQKYGENTLFVLEDLTGISYKKSKSSKNKTNQLNSWAFYQLEQFITYKAHENKSEVVKIDPWNTSQRCPKCGSVHKKYRHHDIHEYICGNCGYRSNDDRIGAINIQMLGALWISGNEKPSIKKLTALE